MMLLAQKWVKNGSQKHFSKSYLGPSGMPKHVFLAHFELVVMRLGSVKIPKCFGDGLFLDQKRVDNGSKSIFPSYP